MTVVSLKRLLVQERAVQASDGAGGFSISWEALGSIWAEIMPGAGRDAGGEEVTLTSVPYRITVRGAPQGSARRPAAGQRFRDGARVFRILAVAERDAAGQHLNCFCREEIPV